MSNRFMNGLNRKQTSSVIDAQGEYMMQLDQRMFSLEANNMILAAFTSIPEEQRTALNAFLSEEGAQIIDRNNFMQKLATAIGKIKAGQPWKEVPAEVTPEAAPEAETPSIMDQILAGETKVLP